MSSEMSGGITAPPGALQSGELARHCPAIFVIGGFAAGCERDAHDDGEHQVTLRWGGALG